MLGAIPPLPCYAFKAWFPVKQEAQGQRYLYLTFAGRNAFGFSKIATKSYGGVEV
jgi:hypothetical protein